MKVRSLTIAAVFACLASVPSAQSASLTGDNLVRATFIDDSGNVFYNETSPVIVGVDQNLFDFDLLLLDFNAGSAQDTFTFEIVLPSTALTVPELNLFLSDFNNITLSDLNFDDAFNSITFLNNTVGATVTNQTATSISFVWDDLPVVDGVLLSFRFNSAPTAAVPLPAALPMMLLGLGALGLVARRRRA